MPINFEATFTQPLLAEIDAGRIRSASDWARLVTKYYVATIKTGLPNGIPPTLPSPAQLGAPYAMGNTFYNTIDSRSRLMENIIKNIREKNNYESDNIITKLKIFPRLKKNVDYLA